MYGKAFATHLKSVQFIPVNLPLSNFFVDESKADWYCNPGPINSELAQLFEENSK